jgi:hypothetical protein
MGKDNYPLDYYTGFAAAAVALDGGNCPPAKPEEKN